MKRKCFFSTKKRFLALYCIVLFVIVGLYVAYRFYVRDLREFYGGLFRNELNALPHVFVCFVPFWGWLAVIGISVVQENHIRACRPPCSVGTKNFRGSTLLHRSDNDFKISFACSIFLRGIYVGSI